MSAATSASAPLQTDFDTRFDPVNGYSIDAKSYIDSSNKEISLRDKLFTIPEHLREHVFIDNAIKPSTYPGRGNVKVLSSSVLRDVKETLRDMNRDGEWGDTATIHFLGTKTCPGAPHPKWLDQVKKGEIILPPHFQIYKAGSPMPEITLVVDTVKNTAKLFGMAVLSNFDSLAVPRSLRDCGVKLQESSAILLIDAMIYSPEHLIHYVKLALAASINFHATNLTATRLETLKKLGFDVDVDIMSFTDPDGRNHACRTLDFMSDALEHELFIFATKTTDAAKVKEFGRIAAVKKEYFNILNGEPRPNGIEDVNLVEFESKIGLGGLIMALGLLLRWFDGDGDFIDIITACHELNITVEEAAVHGGYPDLNWGVLPLDARSSPHSIGVKTTKPVLGIFGLGHLFIRKAMGPADDLEARAARRILGFDEYTPLSADNNNIYLVAVANKILTKLA